MESVVGTYRYADNRHPPPPGVCVCAGMIGLSGEFRVSAGIIGLRGDLRGGHHFNHLIILDLVYYK
jgi:hypothetical protein